MACGDFPNPPGMVWSDAFGWHVPQPIRCDPPDRIEFIWTGAFVLPYVVPNRLYGAEINHRGEAI